jgi:predicted Zn-ribbon and HTH transcriptional regulator
MPSSPAPENQTAPPPRCPVCASEFIDRRSRHGLRDYFRFLVGRFPFRCRRCGHEFYLPQRGTGL